MSPRIAGFLFLVALCPAAVRADSAAEARAAIEIATNRALDALRAGNEAEYRAVLAPGFRTVGAKQPVIGFVTPQRNGLDAGGTAAMRLEQSVSALRTMRMPRAREAVVTGQETLVWSGAHGPDLRTKHPNGQVSVIPNTERRTVEVTYRRYWVKIGDRWRLKRSRTLSEKISAVL